MFVIDSSVAERSYDDVCEEIESTISKHGGSVVDLRKWDERRLAYEVERARRGVYILVHFEAPPESMALLRRDFDLSENILRQLLLIDADGVPSGDERPGITTSISEPSHRRRSKSRRGGTRKHEEEGPGEEEAGASEEDETGGEDDSEEEDAGVEEAGKTESAGEEKAAESDEEEPGRKADSADEQDGGDDAENEPGKEQ